MSRQPRRASGLKALEAITTRSKATQQVIQPHQASRYGANHFFFSLLQKSENENNSLVGGGLKRLCSPSTKMPQRKRNALTTVDTNNVSAGSLS